MTKAQQRKIARGIAKLVLIHLKQAVENGIPENWNAVELWWLAENYSRTAFSKKSQPRKRVRDFNNECLIRSHL